ncbi:MAG: hypothetical protein NZ551_01190 [Microscillaceae bacterium]|nr:hypothetical protein [Microscillaceae bacterium]MDW8459804.1 hypothetical protein [Cytophagales bacterium]
MNIALRSKFLALLLNVCLPFVNQNAQAQQEAELYEEVKKDLLCKTIDFCLNENSNPEDSLIRVNCSTIETIAESIPKEYLSTARFLRLFKNKKYESYGKGKLQTRLNKLIQDLTTELSKMRQDRAWKETVKVFAIELQSIKQESLDRLQGKSRFKVDNIPDNKQTPEKETNTNIASSTYTTTNNTYNHSLSQNSMLVYFLILALIGGIAFLYYQIKELQKQITEIQEQLTEKYSRLDNRLDTFTPIREHQALMQKFNFLNEQVSAIIQEILTLKSRNQYKVSPEEIYAQRTEHLEKQRTAPNIRIFYAQLNTQENNFEEQNFKTEPTKEHFYKVEVNPNDLEKAYFSVTDRNEYHHLALQYWENYLLPATEFDYPPHNDTKIVTIERGELVKENQRWRIVKKAKVTFE